MAASKNKNCVRVFRANRSLTDQLAASTRQFQSLYDALMVQVVIFMIYVLIRDSYQAGRLHLDLSLMYAGIGSAHSILIFSVLELGLISGALFVHPAFKLWQAIRSRCGLFPLRLFVDGSFASLYFAGVLTSAVVMCWSVFNVPFSPFITAAAAIEQMRLCMKSYSFIRENAYKVLYPWHKDDESGPAVWYGGQMEPKVGSFSKYLFFLFCPTFLYRDNYPSYPVRNPGPINWRNAAIYFTQFLTTIWYISVLYRDFMFPSSLRLDDLVHCYLSSLLCAFLMLVLIHTCVLHSYLNFVSELFRFADREFYQDWWASTTFSSYYRKWNTLVHDWIHSYLYRDMKALFKSTLPAVFISLLASSFVHESFLALVLGFFNPVLMLEFGGLGVIFYLMRPFGIARLSNLFVLVALSLGGANLFFYYQVEFAARLYCPKQVNLYDFFKPRMFEYIHVETLFQLDVLVFVLVDLLSGSYVLATVITFLVFWLLTMVRSSLGQRNIGRKTLVDNRFLI